jgi:sentrin-specific protease 8
LKQIYSSEAPEVTQAIKLMRNPNEINAIFLEPLDIRGKQFIIFAINDNSSASAGGSHWSLLVYSRPDKRFFHFDSAGSLNSYVCSDFVEVIKKCLCLSKDEEACEQVQCLQQNNSYDCGIYVLCHADLACKTIMKVGKLLGIQKVNYKSVIVKRQEIIELSESLVGGQA